jgi:Flp pilus assembly protein TadG
MKSFKQIRCQSSSTRRFGDPHRGAVAVEFAIVAPILVALMLGMIEMGRAFEMQNLLEVAAREAARFASMDRDGMLQPGQTANQKLIADTKTLLASNGIPKDSITVEVKDYANPTQDFNIDDPANDLRLFEVRISVPVNSISLRPSPGDASAKLVGSVVFRNGRATISE